MRPACTLLLRLLLMTLLWNDRCAAVKWLALYRNKQKVWNQTQNCSRSDGLIRNQLKLCKQNLDLMSTVTHASLLAFEACQEQFSDRRWNCSSIQKVPRLMKDLVRGSREQAFVYAIASAALVHSVARACSIGVTTKCSCGALPNSPPPGSFKWGGCGDDVQFGLRFSTAFTDISLVSKRRRKKKKAKMNRHNNEAGRKVVGGSLTTACKCHGVSGSCSIKTCWKALPDFDVVGSTLKSRYAVAVEVKMRRRKKTRHFVPINPTITTIRDDELIYYAKSPDYCSPDQKTGSIGTHGRLCDNESRGAFGCDSMCCGRGYNGFVRKIAERCECRYIWCCYVKCKTCTRSLHLNSCR